MNGCFTVVSERDDGAGNRQGFRRKDTFAVFQSVDAFVDGIEPCLLIAVPFLDDRQAFGFGNEAVHLGLLIGREGHELGKTTPATRPFVAVESGADFDPFPTFLADLAGGFLKFLGNERFKQNDVVDEHAVFTVAEQIAYRASGLFIGLEV
jgi:hypothetical protein